MKRAIMARRMLVVMVVMMMCMSGTTSGERLLKLARERIVQWGRRMWAMRPNIPTPRGAVARLPLDNGIFAFFVVYG